MAPPVAYSRLYLLLSRRWWLAFVLMGVTFVVFGLASLNLLHLLSANLEFLGSYGWDAVREGGLWQLLELVVNGVIAAACYIAFKLCEKILVERLSVSKNKEVDS
ncbi:MAG: hypothetical protein ABI605_18060 [Rhizobacter sp.]